MSLRIQTGLLFIICFSTSSFAQFAPFAQFVQTTQRQSNIPKANDPQAMSRQAAPKGWVWVTQTIDLSKQLGLDNIMTLDGEPVPSMVRLRVTLGLIIDDQGHIVTRLIDVSPGKPPINITV